MMRRQNFGAEILTSIAASEPLRRAIYGITFLYLISSSDLGA